MGLFVSRRRRRTGDDGRGSFGWPYDHVVLGALSPLSKAVNHFLDVNVCAGTPPLQHSNAFGRGTPFIGCGTPFIGPNGNQPCILTRAGRQSEPGGVVLHGGLNVILGPEPESTVVRGAYEAVCLDAGINPASGHH